MKLAHGSDFSELALFWKMMKQWSYKKDLPFVLLLSSFIYCILIQFLVIWINIKRSTTLILSYRSYKRFKVLGALNQRKATHRSDVFQQGIYGAWVLQIHLNFIGQQCRTRWLPAVSVVGCAAMRPLATTPFGSLHQKAIKLEWVEYNRTNMISSKMSKINTYSYTY